MNFCKAIVDQRLSLNITPVEKTAEAGTTAVSNEDE